MLCSLEPVTSTPSKSTFGRRVRSILGVRPKAAAQESGRIPEVGDSPGGRDREEALRASENRFRTFIENAGVGIYRSTPDGRIVMANCALIRIMGYGSFEELALRNLESEGFEEGHSRREFKERVERSGTLTGWESAWKRRDGTTIHVRESASVIRGADGAVEFYDGVVEDISERKRAESALRESEERFRNLTEAAFEGIFVSENGRLVDVNDQGLRLIGCTRAGVLGRDVVDFVGPESRDFVSENIRNNSETAYQFRMLRRDGSVFEAEAHAKMMNTGGKVLRMTAVRDITERLRNEQGRRNLEEQLRHTQKMDALGTLAGGIAHDFNNILTGILGNLQLAELDLPAGSPVLASIGASVQACRRARDLVARILSFSRLSQDNRETGSLGPTILEAVELLRVGLAGAIQIRTRIDGACPPVLFDSGQMHQVVMNLGTNAIQAIRGGGGVITLELSAVAPDRALRELHPQVAESHGVRLTVRDTGCGMEPAVLKHLFEPFYTTKPGGQGTGLGLAMVHAIVKSHEGAIVVESAPGKGSRFDLYFPAAEQPAAPAGPAPQAFPGQTFAPFGNGRRIMLVDDQDTVRAVGSTLLERMGFSPAVYGKPVEALEAFRAAPAGFAAVITDLAMPEMTGLEFAGHVLSIRPGVPFIVASGYMPSEMQHEARGLGVRCVIGKPFELEEMIARIRAMVDKPV